MTDKEKIVAYIDKLLEKYPKNYYLLMIAEFIDSLQEEPISEQNLSNVERIGKNWKEEPVSRDYREIYKNIAQSDAFKSAYENKSLGEVMSVEGEEPVSDECIYNRTLEERQRSCKFCSAACQVRIKEDPVSEDLEQAAKKYAMKEYPWQHGYESWGSPIKDFKAGANRNNIIGIFILGLCMFFYSLTKDFIIIDDDI